jgi:S1 RNA binding domain protein
MGFEVGSIVSGKVVGITKFGAFISFESGQSGLVHISEIANSYVTDVRAHVKEGQEVTVKVIGIDAENRINLSIKAAQPQKPAPALAYSAPARKRNSGAATDSDQPQDTSFEDKLKRFMQESDSKIGSLKKNNDRKIARRRGK